MRKKILLCITKAAAGGAQKYIYDIAIHLPADRFDIAVVAGASGPLFVRLQESRIRTISVPSLGRDISPINELKSFFNLARIFINEKPDIIHLNSSKMGAMGAAAAFVSKLLTLNFKPRVVFTVHGWGFREDRNMAQRAAIFAVSWISSRFHNHVITINTADHKDSKTFIPHKRISLIPLGISIPAFLPRKQAREFFSKKSGTPINEDTLLLGVTAELNKNKGLTHLIDAISRLPASEADVRCIIMGEGEERARLTQQIKTLDLENRVVLTGFVTDAYRYLPAFDLFVLPSVKEGLPYAMMEAMNAKLPIIASRVGGIPDLIAHETSGLLTPAKDSLTLAAHISRLIASPEERQTLAARAQETVTSRYSLERMITQTVNLYDQLT
ncbi:MAG: glycosyltransferase family 4 protein [bacterium]|nr:glycosyltransferase family 4 protein [bacterium]MDZ4285834.1 glycosyltransferase family 4 protein [Candidatus Sungbacteria bacterium]